MSEPYRICFCSPPRRRPDAAAWPTTRDVRQPTEPVIRPLGYVTSAFIEDKARRLSIPLAGSVPPLHLLRPIHSAGGDLSILQAACLPIPLAGSTSILPRAPRSSLLARYQGSSRHISILCGLRTSWRPEIAQALLALVTPTMYSFHYAPRPTCRGSASLYVPPLSYKKEGTQRYKTSSLRP
jgi:hypothetical protein